jgi:hypothetical protein
MMHVCVRVSWRVIACFHVCVIYEAGPSICTHIQSRESVRHDQFILKPDAPDPLGMLTARRKIAIMNEVRFAQYVRIVVCACYDI